MTAPEGIVDRKEILPLLGSVKRQGKWLMAYCPAHADGSKHNGKSGQSLGLSDEGVLRCFAKCSFGDVMSALRKNGPRVAAEGAVGRQNEPGWRATAVYAYARHDGSPGAEHVRLEIPDPESPKGYRKRFVWRVSAEDRRTLRDAGLTEPDLALYGLATLDIAGPDGWVNFVEGEKCQSALAARHLAAVCAGGGAGQRDFGPAFERLRGRKVRIWPDNDPPGAEYAAVVRRALLAVGATKVVVMPPVGGPGGDLFDYLAGGGNLDHLLAGVLTEDAIDFVADDHLRIRIPTDAGEMAFEIDEIERGPRTLDCYLTVEWRSALSEGPYSQRLNWLSASSREALVRVLIKQFPETKSLNWTALLGKVLAHVRNSLGEIDISEDMAPDESGEPMRFLLPDYLPEGGGMLLYGPPKRGKSTTALIMAVMLDAGLATDWLAPGRAARVLYVNIERPTDAMRKALARVNQALGLPAGRSLRFINRRGASLMGIMPDLRAAIRRHGIEVVILDSISRAGFGKLIADDVANAVTDAMNSLGTAWIAIGHQRRPGEDGEEPDHIFGSVHFDAAADVLIKVRSKQAGSDLHVELSVVESNHGKRPDPLGIVFTYDQNGLVHVRARSGAETAVEGVPGRVLELLRDQPVELNATEISEMTGLQRPHVSRALSKLTKDGLARPRREGKAVFYRPAERVPSAENDLGTHGTHAPRGLAGERVPSGGYLLDTPIGTRSSDPGTPAPAERKRTNDEAEQEGLCVYCDESLDVFAGPDAVPCCAIHRWVEMSA